MEIIYKSYAKINLGLEIVAKRHDGYHNINSIFLPIALADELLFHKSSNFNITIEPKTIDIPITENIIYKTIKLIQNKYKINTNLLHIHLVKNIPIGAGLGGGSSNAATTLLALNDLYSLDLSKEELVQIARQLGADVPFFLDPKPSLVSGIGDIIEPIDFPFEFDIVLVYPKFSISTAFAYSLVQNPFEKKPTDYKKLVQKLKDISEFRQFFFNDFEQYLFPRFPILQEIKENLYNLGAKFASLSGSGSTVYGLFEKSTKLENLLARYFQSTNILLTKILRLTNIK